jgi:hypothetical protein
LVGFIAYVKGIRRAVPIVELRPGIAPNTTPKRTPPQIKRRVVKLKTL